VVPHWVAPRTSAPSPIGGLPGGGVRKLCLGTGGQRWKGDLKIAPSLSKVDVVELIRWRPTQLGRNRHGIGTKMHRVISCVNAVGRK